MTGRKCRRSSATPAAALRYKTDLSVATAVAQRFYDRIHALWLIPGNQAVSRFGIGRNQTRLLKFALGTVGEETLL